MGRGVSEFMLLAGYLTRQCFQRSTTAAVSLSAILLLTTLCRAQAPEEEMPPPPPETISLLTKDGVQLQATWYPGTKQENTVPLILLHGSGGKRGDLDRLALHLQAQGHAVLAPDLRGHGESTTKQGQDRPLTADRMPATEYLQIGEDLEACKKFLMERHHNRELNIERLGVIGADMGATVALLWAKHDWSWPPLATGKQGQDVRALVLISPEWTHKSLRVGEAVTDERVRSDISVYIIAGQDSPQALRDARRIHRALEPYHPEPPPERRAAEQDLFFQAFATSLQGTKMLGGELGLDNQISRFIELRLVAPDIPWQRRESPLAP